MRYLVIGSGGREHALAWKLASEEGSRVFVAPGSEGIALSAGIESVSISPNEHELLSKFAQDEKIDLTVVGPEGPLCAGLADYFRERGLDILGPSAGAAQLEGSKAFAKQLMADAGIPTAKHEVFDDLTAAEAYVTDISHPLVIKADGLAGGKGVVISTSREQSSATLRSFMAEHRFGAASTKVVIEECLDGPELSFMVVTDGDAIVTLSTSRDHKRLLDDDLGPNTGGMGAITPSPDTTPELEAQIVESVIAPTLAELRRRGLDYRGFLYVGLMLTQAGPKVLEFNVRLGDPETQALLLAMDQDLGPTLLAAARGELESGSLATSRCACCVVLAAPGYPASPQKGDVISGLAESAPDVRVFHAGTRRTENGWLTDGGRVLGVTARGRGADEVRLLAYETAAKITWRGVQMRVDIGT